MPWILFEKYKIDKKKYICTLKSINLYYSCRTFWSEGTMIIKWPKENLWQEHIYLQDLIKTDIMWQSNEKGPNIILLAVSKSVFVLNCNYTFNLKGCPNRYFSFKLLNNWKLVYNRKSSIEKGPINTNILFMSVRHNIEIDSFV